MTYSLTNYFLDDLETLFGRKGTRSMDKTYHIDTAETHTLIEVDVPGIPKKDLKITCENDRITIESTGTRQLRRSFWIDSNLFNTDKLEAKLDLGVLSITIPKTTKKTKTVEIQ